MSRTNPDWYLDPPEERENPRCGVCDQQMREISYAFLKQKVYECDNPDCEECSEKYKVERDDD